MDPGSLQNLHDIVVPDPASFWPPAPGWYALAVLVLMLAVWTVSQLYIAWKNNRYRREALAELDRLAAGSSQAEYRIGVLRQLNALLKRTALAVWPRTEVADLSGDRWLAFLDRTGGTTSFGREPVSLLSEISFARQDKLSNLPDARVAELMAAARKWIKKHKRNGQMVAGSKSRKV